MRVLLIGATGLLGTVLQEEWGGDAVTGVGSRDVDIRDESQVRRLFERTRPEWTVLAAAYADVDGCKRDPQRAHDVNCIGAMNVARAARDVQSKLFFVSTDYVFDGSVEAVRTEDVPRPAPRPKYSVLSTTNLERYGLRMRRWQDTLPGYFADRMKTSNLRQELVSNTSAAARLQAKPGEAQ